MAVLFFTFYLKEGCSIYTRGTLVTDDSSTRVPLVEIVCPARPCLAGFYELVALDS